MKTTIVESTKEHADYLAVNMREQDIKEIFYSHAHNQKKQYNKH